MSAPRLRWYRFLWPQYWPLWLALGLMRHLAGRSDGTLLRVGRGLGALASRLPLPQRRVVQRNLEWCFPDLTRAERRTLQVTHFLEAGLTLPETALAWFAPVDRLRALVRFEGLADFDRLQAEGRGVILLAAHFTTLEIGARLITAVRPVHAVYKPSKNPLLSEFFRRYRGAVSAGMIASDDIRGMVRVLKSGGAVWYAPDQAYRGKGAVNVPLFGRPATTNPATPRLAVLTGAVVLPYFVERLPGELRYVVRIGPALEDFPSDDPVRDLARHHRLIETEARRLPAQYLWLHKRFKPLDPDSPDPYSRRS